MSKGRYQVSEKPDGTFTVDRLMSGRIERWGRYESREIADRHCKFANQFTVEPQAAFTLDLEAGVAWHGAEVRK